MPHTDRIILIDAVGSFFKKENKKEAISGDFQLTQGYMYFSFFHKGHFIYCT